MLTPYLENLVLNSQAEVKTHNHGVGGVGSILVPKGKQIIITQIIWNPFVDVTTPPPPGDEMKVMADPKTLYQQSGSFLHTLKLRNKSKKYAFTFRDTVDYPATQQTGGFVSYKSPKPAIVVDTYLPFTEGLVEIDIMKFTDFSEWNVISNKLPPYTIEPAPGEGYGTGNMPLSYNTALVSNYLTPPPPYSPNQYLPPTNERIGNTNPDATNEFEGTIPLTLINNPLIEGPPNDLDVSMFPIVTFTYVLINARYIPGNTTATVDYKKK